MIVGSRNDLWLPSQASSKRGCTPGQDNITAYDAFYDPERLKRVRRVYLAELEEFDAMVGTVVDAVRAAGRSDDTYIVLAAGESWLAVKKEQRAVVGYSSLCSL